MIGYFGQAYFGGNGDGAASGGAPPGQNTRLAAEAAVAVDWDVQVETNPGDSGGENGQATESVITTGLGVGGTTKVLAESGTASESTPITTGLGIAPPPPPPVVVVTNSVIRFLDGVAGNVRMDLNNSYWRVLKEGTDTPPPPMEDQRTSSMLTDGELVSASVYRNRTVTLALALNAPNQAFAYREIQALQRELDRPSNVLMYQPDDSQPAWYFRTYRGPDVATDFDYGISHYKFVLELEAEPFALGEEIQLGTYAIPHNPAGSPGLWFDVTGIRGDVDTPLFIRTSDTDLVNQTVALSTRRRGIPANVTIFRQAEDGTVTKGADTTVITGTDSSNGSVARCTFTSGHNINAVRLSGRFPSETGASPDWNGTYRVFARMRRVIGGADMFVQVATGTTSAAARNHRVKVDTVDWSMFDLGLVQLPPGNAGHTAGYGSAYSAEGGTLYFYAERTAGGGGLEVDYLVTLPADEDYAFIQMPTFATGGQAVIDGPNGAVYPLGGTGALRGITGAAPYADGALPTVSPTAQTNRVYWVADIHPSAAIPPIGTAYTVTVSYWPRYLMVRAAGS